ncbi:MAG: hypothetical protein QM715_20355 [Nibricoccus sp.]
MPRGLKIILAVSLLANLGLAAVYFHARHAPSLVSSRTTTINHAQTTPLASNWQALAAATASDDQAYVARLRAEGFPANVLRAFMKAELAERFAEQRRIARKATGKDDYWRDYNARYRANPEAQAALRALDRQQDELLHRLLGPDALSPLETARRIRRFGNLSADKLHQLQLLSQDYNDMSQQIRQTAGTLQLKEDKDEIEYLYKERDADIAALLAPDELIAYQLRESPTAFNLQWKIRAFDATEQEYETLYSLQKSYEDQNKTANPEERKKAEQLLIQSIEAALGSERYTEYKITTDGSFVGVVEVTNNQGLPPAIAKEAVAYKLDVIQRWTAIKQDPVLTQADRDAKIAALVAEAKAALSQKLGPAGFTEYCKNNNISSWIDNVAKSTGPSKP